MAAKLLNKAGEMPSLNPPEDESIRTLYVGGLDARINDQDLRDHFYAHGEIESTRMVLQRACAFVTYTTREGAEKAAEELSNRLVIKGLRLKLMWGRPQAPRVEPEGSEETKHPAAVAHSGLLPRAVISQQQNQLQPPGAQDMPPPPPHMQYFNIPPPPQHDRSLYPSMDPQRMGALIPSHEGPPGGTTGSGESKSGYGYPPMQPPQGQFHQQFYTPYGYMPPQPPPYQQYPQQPYLSTMPPQPPPPVTQQYHQTAPPVQLSLQFQAAPAPASSSQQ